MPQVIVTPSGNVVLPDAPSATETEVPTGDKGTDETVLVNQGLSGNTGATVTDPATTPVPNDSAGVAVPAPGSGTETVQTG